MKPRVDTFQVGPASPENIGALIEDKIPAVLEEARKTANGRTITVKAIYTKEGKDAIAYIFIEHLDEPVRKFDLAKQRTVVTEHWTCGVYASSTLEEQI